MRSLLDRAQGQELAAAHRRLGELEARVTQLATRDGLVPELLTLRAFRAQLETDLKRAQRNGDSLCLALVDIDGFRALNLRHGYATGDKVLAAVASVLRTQTRAGDLVCRTGGDEFVLLFARASAPAAIAVLERILAILETLEAGAVRGLSVSIGLAPLPHNIGSPELLFAAAADALDQARAAGGGRVSLVSDAKDPDASAPTGSGEVVSALVSALQERDRYTGEHSESVVEMAGRVAESLGRDLEEVERIKTAALLHDIGKVGVPDQILHKPGPLDNDEWEVMRQHPAIGERILRAVPGMGRIATIVRHEHERWDGAGYPDAIGGETIPIGARIILACDAYHAMTSDRPYRAAMPHHRAVAELRSHAGSQFDPEVVEVLVGYLYGQRQSGLAVA